MPEDRVKGALAKSIVISGTTVVPQGADLSGSVVEANGSKRVKGKASIVFQFDHLMVRGENHAIAASRGEPPLTPVNPEVLAAAD